MNDKKFYLIGSGSSSNMKMLDELNLNKIENFEYISSPVEIKNNIVHRIFDFYFKINAKVKMPFLKLWEKSFLFPKLDSNKDNYIILMNGAFNYYTSEFLNKIKEKYKVHYIVFLIDPISGFPSDFMKNNLFNTKYDLLYSFDYNDAQQLNAIHSMCIYSKQLIHNNGNYQGGVYFAGTNKKGRIVEINKIYKKLQENNINCKFRITNVKQEEQKYEDIIYNHIIEYSEILEEVQAYDCILENVQPGQSGVTLRYYEAIVYNKKLLTNNKFVKRLPFYNPKFMYIYEKVEDIDIEWIKKEEMVDYKYNDEFSPVKLIEDIKKRVENI